MNKEDNNRTFKFGKERSIAGHKASEQFFQMAKMAAQRSHELSGRSGEQYEAMTAIVLCVVVAESAINEIAEWLEYKPLPYGIPHELPYGFDQLNLRMKWSMLPIIARKTTFDFGKEPWQSFNALIELRNAIVHLRHKPPPKTAYSLLKSNKLIEQRERVGFKVAQWACETMANMLEELMRLLGISEENLVMPWPWGKNYFPHGLSIPGSPFKGDEAQDRSLRKKRPKG
jgi:hypothetical protein